MPERTSCTPLSPAGACVLTQGTLSTHTGYSQSGRRVCTRPRAPNCVGAALRRAAPVQRCVKVRRAVAVSDGGYAHAQGACCPLLCALLHAPRHHARAHGLLHRVGWQVHLRCGADEDAGWELVHTGVVDARVSFAMLRARVRGRTHARTHTRDKRATASRPRRFPLLARTTVPVRLRVQPHAARCTRRRSRAHR